MKLGNKRIFKCALSLFSVFLLLMQFGCVGETVRALDYSLESKLYSVQQDVVPQDANPSPELTTGTDSASPAATPAPTPTPIIEQSTAPVATDVVSPTPQQTGAASETPLPSQTPELHRLTVLAQDASALALSGARVSLYQDHASDFGRNRNFGN